MAFLFSCVNIHYLRKPDIFNQLKNQSSKISTLQESSSTNVVRCAIWYPLYSLKNVKNTYGGVYKYKIQLVNSFITSFARLKVKLPIQREDFAWIVPVISSKAILTPLLLTLIIICPIRSRVTYIEKPVFKANNMYVSFILYD